MRVPSPDSQPVESTWRPGWPIDLDGTLGPLRRGSGDPTHRVTPDGALWRTARTPEGAATLRLVVRPGDGEVRATAWGPGAGWALAGVPDLLGASDDPTGFAPRHPLLRATWSRRPGLRVPRAGLVLEMLVPAVLEQKVTGHEARQSWRRLLRTYGEVAPGPAPVGMLVCPPAPIWARVPSWEWHRAGVDGKRASTIVRAAGLAARLEQTLALSWAEAERRLLAVPGVGAWTAAEVGCRAHGHADALSVGDFHLAALVGWALFGRPITDAQMVEALADYRPHRYRAVRLIELSGVRKPRFGPRLAPRDLRAI